MHTNRPGFRVAHPRFVFLLPLILLSFGAPSTIAQPATDTTTASTRISNDRLTLKVDVRDEIGRAHV